MNRTMTVEQIEEIDWILSSQISDYKLGKHGYGSEVTAKVEKLKATLEAFRQMTAE